MIIGGNTPLQVDKHTSAIVSPGNAARFREANGLGGSSSTTIITLATAAANAALASIVVDDGEVVVDAGEVVWDTA